MTRKSRLTLAQVVATAIAAAFAGMAEPAFAGTAVDTSVSVSGGWESLGSRIGDRLATSCIGSLYRARGRGRYSGVLRGGSTAVGTIFVYPTGGFTAGEIVTVRGAVAGLGSGTLRLSQRRAGSLVDGTSWIDANVRSGTGVFKHAHGWLRVRAGTYTGVIRL